MASISPTALYADRTADVEISDDLSHAKGYCHRCQTPALFEVDASGVSLHWLPHALEEPRDACGTWQVVRDREYELDTQLSPEAVDALMAAGVLDELGYATVVNRAIQVYRTLIEEEQRGAHVLLAEKPSRSRFRRRLSATELALRP